MSSPAGQDTAGMDLPVGSVASRAVDDMEDRPEQWPALAARLEECRQIIEPVYRKADAAAMRHQRMHQWLTKIAAFSGTLAVLVVIIGLPFHPVLRNNSSPSNQALNETPNEGSKQESNETSNEGSSKALKIVGEISDTLEPVAALAAFAAVLLGLIVAKLDRWLVERHKAERCRLLKFGFLTDPALWGGDEQKLKDRIDQLRNEVAAIDAVRTIEEPRRWLAEVHNPPFLGDVEDYRGGELLLRQLITYYRNMRLHAQIDYFHNRIDRYASRDQFTKRLPQWLFFASVFAALVHFILNYIAQQHDPSQQQPWYTAAVGTAYVAAILPVLGAGIRTYRMANEFGRNVRRYESTEHMLKERDKWLERGMDAKSLFLTLWSCEHTLEIEHREWLRLMAETEWFG
jgi:hypothetical protein